MPLLNGFCVVKSSVFPLARVRHVKFFFSPRPRGSASAELGVFLLASSPRECIIVLCEAC